MTLHGTTLHKPFIEVDEAFAYLERIFEGGRELQLFMQAINRAIEILVTL